MSKDSRETNPMTMEAHLRLVYRKLEEICDRLEALESVAKHQHKRLSKLETAVLELQDTKPLEH
jgi:hypothetical protein